MKLIDIYRQKNQQKHINRLNLYKKDGLTIEEVAKKQKIHWRTAYRSIKIGLKLYEQKQK